MITATFKPLPPAQAGPVVETAARTQMNAQRRLVKLFLVIIFVFMLFLGANFTLGSELTVLKWGVNPIKKMFQNGATDLD